MDLSRQPESVNFEDRTGWDERQRKLHTLATLLNPALAATKIHDWLQANGHIPIRPEADY
jgi:hypothetical protein